MPNKPLFSPLFRDAVFPLLARLFISAIFVQGVLGKILGWSGQAAYMQSHNLPGQLIPAMLGIALVIEAAGVLCLIVGWQARVAAFVMCVYLGVVSVLVCTLKHSHRLPLKPKLPQEDFCRYAWQKSSSTKPRWRTLAGQENHRPACLCN